MDPTMHSSDAGADRGRQMHEFLRETFPFCRSITGQGVRDTLQAVGRHVPLQLHEVPTGTPVLDWVIPNEWNIRDAWLKDPNGRVIAPFAETNLRVVNYSPPIHRRMPLAELRPHLYSIPSRPDRVPYKTSYFEPNWGFCLRHDELQTLVDGEYEVFIDSTLAPGSLTYAECFIPGATPHEVLISCHTCHPSMANDSLSGVVLTTFLAKTLLGRELRYSYRFLFAPATVGAVTWLALNPEVVERVTHGLVVTCVGDPGPFTYKKSRQGDAEIDRAAAHVLATRGGEHHIVDFTPYGGDERQFCSPGYDLAVGALMRSPYWEYEQYHSSADTPDVVTAEALGESLDAYVSVLDVIERNRRYQNLQPYGEPMLGRRGLFRAMGGALDARSREYALLWVLNQSDGRHSLLDIAERSRLPFHALCDAVDALVKAELLKELPDDMMSTPSHKRRPTASVGAS